MRGKWAAGIPPRNFTWVIRDRLAVSERPGGFAANHRRVRRQEEIIWLRAQAFSRVVSLLPSTHNLQAYDEEGMPWSHYPLVPGGDPGRSWPTSTATSTASWPPACGCWSIKTSWATGSWGWWPGFWCGRAAWARSPRPPHWSSRWWATRWGRAAGSWWR